MEHRLRVLAALTVALCFALSSSLLPLRAADTTVAKDRVWFCPVPGSIDYLSLFERPEEWPHARQLVNVFKFYQQHTQTPAPSIVGANTYDALVRADAFRRLSQWGIKIAIEVGAVKAFYCTPDASGMDEAIANTVASVRAVEAAGGDVAYLAMDEPFVSGRSKVCDGPDLAPTADRVATYVHGVSAALPQVQIGLIEAYPFSSESALENAIQLLKARGVPPAFLHMDTDWVLSGASAFKADMAKMQAFCAAQSIPFGNIIIGASGASDALYAVDAGRLTELIAETYQTWDRMPDHLVVQSWIETTPGLFITPSNLPESRRFTHTAILSDVWRRLRGGVGGAAGVAIPRRK